ncbi:MAG: hypothetical protein GY737_04655 [Desulfobacteraceae bacterium]|nr:hypothetical protein [Desulfobacteraceae bacterium]
MNENNFIRQCKLFFRNRAVNETVENISCCITSGNLAEKQRSLAKAVKGTVKVFNREIGRLGGGSIREILKTQEISRISGKRPAPFNKEIRENATCLEIRLGKVPDGDGEVTVDIAFSENRGKWYYTGRAGNDTIISDVLEFTTDEIKNAVKIISCAVVILNEVYNTPESPMDLFVTKINEMQLAGPHGPILLPE